MWSFSKTALPIPKVLSTVTLRKRLLNEINISLAFLKDSLLPDDFNKITFSVKSKYHRALCKLTNEHEWKLNKLLDEQNHDNDPPGHINKRFIINLSDHSVLDYQTRILNKSLKFVLPDRKLPALDLFSSVASRNYLKKKSDLCC